MNQNRKQFSSELALLIGLLLNSFCVSLLAKSDFGISTLSSVPLVLSKIITQISFGTWNFLIQALTIILLIIITHKPKISYIGSFVLAYLFGNFIDFYNQFINLWPNTFFFRIVYFFIGFTFIAIGASLFLKCKLPVLPFDNFVRDICEWSNLSVQYVKTIFDFVCVLITTILSFWFLGHLTAVGVGTILGMLFTGSMTHSICKYLDRKYQFQGTFEITRRYINWIE